MKHRTRLHSEQEQQQTVAENQARQTASREFATVEELLRHDAAQTTVPPGIARRLEKSIGQTQPLPQSWWKSLLGL
ncbi:MAG: hypothetical protein KGJ60_15390 [Verrucomicrobiota bacterium]|nr:hypothetical protein [Verrucomicrobiota bacterium]